MAPEHGRQIEALYEKARAGVLAAATGSVRREIEPLLAQEETAAMQTTLADGGAGALTQLGPYKIDAKLGEGGMGEVFRATDTRLHRTVAIKMLRGQGSTDPSARVRFQQEARACVGAESSEHLHGTRHRRGRWTAVPGDGVPGRGNASGEAAAWKAPASGTAGSWYAGGGRARRGAFAWHRPPGHQAREYLHHQARPGKGDGFRLGKDEPCDR